MPNIVLLTSRNIAVSRSPHRRQQSTLIPVGTLARRLMSLGLLLTSVSLCGCQCFCRGTNAWSAVIDCGTDHAVPLDCVYCSWLDLTRIGRPGGLPGRSCCRCSQCCSSATVYVHRWNMPKPREVSAPEGLQNIPDLPGTSSDPYFPPPAETDEATPLFPMPPESSLPSNPEAATPTDVPEPINDGGVVRMYYERPASDDAPASPADSNWVLPTRAIFGNF
ncbi:MAG: hypothetical protein ACK5Q5_00660 [Planctomycetaceae bacterium]